MLKIISKAVRKTCSLTELQIPQFGPWIGAGMLDWGLVLQEQEESLKYVLGYKILKFVDGPH